MIDIIKKALARATADRDAGRAVWVPVFVDVILAGEKIGHIVSDGYTNQSWSFYSADGGRRDRRDRPLDLVLPAWASGSVLQDAKTYRETHKVEIDALAANGQEI